MIFIFIFNISEQISAVGVDGEVGRLKPPFQLSQLLNKCPIFRRFPLENVIHNSDSSP